MVNPGAMPGKLQSPIGMKFPLLAPARHKRAAVPPSGFDAREPVPVRLPQGQQDVSMVMAGVAFTRNGVVQGQVGDHPLRHELLHHEAPNERQPLLGRQLMRQGDIDFSGKLRIAALFKLLDMVPEGFSLSQPFRGSLRQQNFLMNHAALRAVVKSLPLPLILQTLGSPIGCYSKPLT